jgi:hypothetical protein
MVIAGVRAAQGGVRGSDPETSPLGRILSSDALFEQGGEFAALGIDVVPERLRVL